MRNLLPHATVPLYIYTDIKGAQFFKNIVKSLDIRK